MKIKTVGLIGFGVVGIPIAHKLNSSTEHSFFLIASGFLRDELENTDYRINGEPFEQKVISDRAEIRSQLDLLIVCVKNYHLDHALEDIKRVITEKTIILPLQNGLYSFNFFARNFPDNIVLKGYMQGPNTEINGGNITYKAPGTIHIGSNRHTDVAIGVYNALNDADVPVAFENDINHKVWSKWMLNVAGNSVTALTGADYSMFENIQELQKTCRDAMKEFQTIAEKENVILTNEDVDDIIDYFVNFKSGKKTSMLVDMLNKRETENEYLAGYAVKLAKKHGLNVPIISTLYSLVKIRETIYLDK